MARGRPGTVRTPPIILFSLPDASVRLSSLLAVLFPLSLFLSFLSPSLTAPFSTPIVSLSPFLERPLLLYRTPSYSFSPSFSSIPSFSFLLARLLALFFLSHVRARERVYGMSLFLPRFRCAPTLKRQLTIGAIHGLLARINCRRKLLQLCRESKLSRVGTNPWHTGAVPREKCLFFDVASLFTQFYLISTRRLLGYYKLKSSQLHTQIVRIGFKILEMYETSTGLCLCDFVFHKHLIIHF